LCQLQQREYVLLCPCRLEDGTRVSIETLEMDHCGLFAFVVPGGGVVKLWMNGGGVVNINISISSLSESSLLLLPIHGPRFQIMCYILPRDMTFTCSIIYKIATSVQSADLHTEMKGKRRG
jgi:hypothetical protein